MRLFVGIGNILFVLLYLCATQALAASLPDEIGASGGWMHTQSSGFGDRPIASVHFTWAYKKPIFLRVHVDVSFIEIAPSVVGLSPDQNGNAMGNFLGVSPGVMILSGYRGDRVRLLVGVGMSYHLRFAKAQESYMGTEVFSEALGSGTLSGLELNDHPGIESCLEFSFRLTRHWWVNVFGNHSYAVTTAYAQIKETDAFFMGKRNKLSAYGGRLGLNYTF